MSNRPKRRKAKGPTPPREGPKPPTPPLGPSPTLRGESDPNTDVWILTEPSIDGTSYMVTIQAGQDNAAVLSPSGALAYAHSLMSTIARAEYDAAVARQLLSVLPKHGEEPPEMAVGQVIKDLREDRPEIDHADTAPLRFTPGVNQQWEPFIEVHIGGEQRLGSWDTERARRHALGMLEVVHAADLDAGYFRVLTGLIGIEPDRARNMIDDLGKWREHAPEA